MQEHIATTNYLFKHKKKREILKKKNLCNLRLDCDRWRCSVSIIAGVSLELDVRDFALLFKLL